MISVSEAFLLGWREGKKSVDRSVREPTKEQVQDILRANEPEPSALDRKVEPPVPRDELKEWPIG